MTALNIDPNFERKMTCAFKNDIRNLANFYQNTFESQKIWTLIGSFYPKQKMYELKIYRKFMCHENEEWCKIWTEIYGSVQNWYEEFNHFWLHHSKISIICIYVCSMALKIDAKFEEKLTCTSKNDMRSFANFHQSTFESLKSWTFIVSFYPK